MELFKLYGQIDIDGDSAKKELEKVENSASKTESVFKNVGKTVGKVGVAIGTMAIVATGKILSFTDDSNKALSKLQLRTDSSNEAMVNLKDIATDLYNQNLGESFDDVASSLGLVSQMGIQSFDEIKELTSQALKLNKVFDIDVKESTRTAIQLMTQFGISGTDAYNLITQGLQNGLDKNGDLLDTLNEYSPQFQQLGFDADEMFNMLVNGSNHGGFSVDKLGDSIKEFNIRVKDQSKTTTEAFSSLGLNADNMSDAFAKGGTSAEQAFIKVLDKLSKVKDPLEQNRIGVALFGTQWEDLGGKAVLSMQDTTGAIDSAKPSLSDLNDTKFTSFTGSLQEIGRNIETNILVPLGEKATPKLKEFNDYIISKMPVIKETVDKALGAFRDGLVWIKEKSDILIPALAGVLGTIIAFQVISTIVKIMELWRTITATMTVAQWLLNIAMNANPIGLIALAIGALIAIGVLLYMNWDTIKEKANQLWKGLKQIFSNIADFISGVFKGAANIAIIAVNKIIDLINSISFTVPDWIPLIGGKKLAVHLNKIPLLASGGTITKSGSAIVGEKGAELLNLPKGASVTPLDKTGSNIILNINNPKFFNQDDIDKFMIPVVRQLKMQGVR